MGNEHTATETAVSTRYRSGSTVQIDPGVPFSALSVTLWTTVLTASAIDLGTTAIGLADGLSEGNALARELVEALGVPGLAGLKLLALIVLATTWYLLEERQGYAALAGFGTATTVVAVINIATIAAS